MSQQQDVDFNRKAVAVTVAVVCFECKYLYILLGNQFFQFFYGFNFTNIFYIDDECINPMLQALFQTEEIIYYLYLYLYLKK